MENDNIVAEMLRRAKAHEQSTIQVIGSKKRSIGANRSDLEAALADEQTTRKELISWQAPNASIAVRKLLHLLAHVLAAELAFDDQSLAEIEAEAKRLGFDGRASSSDRSNRQRILLSGSF
ncbi:hypothetical protein [Rhizobium grahamii]|uniref:Uncharacterized protein n=1 Tax=Rhizobium grahamii CCGE 502 TaxID=990285 RepID=S3ID15_9HYPH|nr:hypothetical protein [Rhizobium grahamii]EPE97048.1 hypothetical protein RGCCGE502_16830 [Rhizobium grahamii CCGE 502]